MSTAPRATTTATVHALEDGESSESGRHRAQAATITTPDGPFTIIAADQAVLASGWTDDVASFLPLIHASLRPALADVEVVNNAVVDGADRGRRSTVMQSAVMQSAVMQSAIRAVNAFYAGDPSELAQVPVAQKSGPYRQLAWDILRTVVVGETVTYTEYAEMTGNPRAARAAASACAKNAAALFVPCHRVVRADGSAGGFRYGLEIKERLLRREAALTSVL